MQHQDNIKIHRDCTKKGNHFYAVIQNPLCEWHDTKVVKGTSEEIVKKKINAIKWKVQLQPIIESNDKNESDLPPF